MAAVIGGFVAAPNAGIDAELTRSGTDPAVRDAVISAVQDGHEAVEAWSEDRERLDGVSDATANPLEEPDQVAERGLDDDWAEDQETAAVEVSVGESADTFADDDWGDAAAEPESLAELDAADG